MGRRQSARCEGRTRKAWAKEKTSVEMTTTGTTARNFPMMPSPQMSGRKAATVVLTLPKTGQMTSRAPRTAASTELSPWL